MSYRNKWIEKLFLRLKKRPYVLLKHLGQVEPFSDIDLLLNQNHTEQIIPLLLKEEGIERYQLLQHRQMWQLLLYAADDSFLQVDFLFGFYRKELCYLSRDEVQNEAVFDEHGLRVCSTPHLLEHLLLFNLLNYAAIPAKYLAYFKKSSASDYEKIRTHLQKKFQIADFTWAQLEKYDPQLRKKIVRQLCKNPENAFLKRQDRKVQYYGEVLRTLGRARGLTISFSGVDGAGKSTIIEEVKATLTKKYRRKVVVLRHRPSLIPILSAYRHGKAAAENRAATRLPRQGENRSKWNSLLRFGYYYSDYLLGQFYVFFRYHLRSYIVLYDRYYFDFIVDGRRSNIQMDSHLPRFLYRFIHKPQLNLFLYASPEIIRQRKKELPADAIRNLTKEYRHLFATLNKERGRDNEFYLSIENEEKEHTLNTIFQHYKLLQQ